MRELVPDKFTSIEQSLVGQAGIILRLLANRPYSVGQCFFAAKSEIPYLTFDSLVLGLSFLYAAGLIQLRDGVLEVI